MAAKRQTRGVYRKRVRTVDDSLKAWELRGQGKSLREIAKTLDLSGPQQAKVLLERGFQEFYSPKVEQRRAEIEEGTRQLMPVFFKGALLGDVDAAREWRALAETLRKLHGIDTPVRTEITGKDGAPLTAPHDALLDRLARLAAAAGAGSGDPLAEPGRSD